MCVFGYGRLDQAPTPVTHPRLCSAARVLRPGDRILLGPRFGGGRGAAVGEGKAAAASAGAAAGLAAVR